MGTRSLTIVKDDNETVVTMYRQYDGHPNSHGLELAEFLLNRTITNGITDYKGRTANGMGCLAAQIVAHFKKDVGGFYLYPTDSKDVGEEYVYTVYQNPIEPSKVNIKLISGEELLTDCSVDNYITEWGE